MTLPSNKAYRLKQELNQCQRPFSATKAKLKLKSCCVYPPNSSTYYDASMELVLLRCCPVFPVGDLYSVGALQPDTKSYNVLQRKRFVGSLGSPLI